MKKSILFVSSLASLLALASCSGLSIGESSANPSSVVDSSELGAEVTLDQASMKALSLTSIASIKGLGALRSNISGEAETGSSSEEPESSEPTGETSTSEGETSASEGNASSTDEASSESTSSSEEAADEETEKELALVDKYYSLYKSFSSDSLIKVATYESTVEGYSYVAVITLNKGDGTTTDYSIFWNEETVKEEDLSNDETEDAEDMGEDNEKEGSGKGYGHGHSASYKRDDGVTTGGTTTGTTSSEGGSTTSSTEDDAQEDIETGGSETGEEGGFPSGGANNGGHGDGHGHGHGNEGDGNVETGGTETSSSEDDSTISSSEDGSTSSSEDESEESPYTFTRLTGILRDANGDSAIKGIEIVNSEDSSTEWLIRGAADEDGAVKKAHAYVDASTSYFSLLKVSNRAFQERMVVASTIIDNATYLTFSDETADTYSSYSFLSYSDQYGNAAILVNYENDDEEGSLVILLLHDDQGNQVIEYVMGDGDRYHLGEDGHHHHGGFGY